MQRLPLAIVLLMLSPLSFAQIYSWTDAGGTVHYSESPPEAGVHYKQISLTGTTKGSPAASAAATSQPEAGATANTLAAPAVPSAPMADTPENRAKFCATLVTNLDQLRGSTPLVVKRDGVDVVLAANQRQTQLDATERQYQQYCQSSP